MPELPEVEIIRTQLSEYLPFKISTLFTSSVLAPGILHTDLPIKNLAITSIKRKGKMLDFVFDNGTHLLCHLGMTGTWLIGEKIKKLNTRISF